LFTSVRVLTLSLSVAVADEMFWVYAVSRADAS
jgi:hypothetical protein